MCLIDLKDKLEDCYLKFNKKETTSEITINEDVYIYY